MSTISLQNYFGLAKTVCRNVDNQSPLHLRSVASLVRYNALIEIVDSYIVWKSVDGNLSNTPKPCLIVPSVKTDKQEQLHECFFSEFI